MIRPTGLGFASRTVSRQQKGRKMASLQASWRWSVRTSVSLMVLSCALTRAAAAQDAALDPEIAQPAVEGVQENANQPFQIVTRDQAEISGTLALDTMQVQFSSQFITPTRVTLQVQAGGVILSAEYDLERDVRSLENGGRMGKGDGK